MRLCRKIIPDLNEYNSLSKNKKSPNEKLKSEFGPFISKLVLFRVINIWFMILVLISVSFKFIASSIYYFLLFDFKECEKKNFQL